MTKYYTDEKQAQVLIALLKAHGIKRVIASPGTTNMAFVGSLQNDSWFEIYSSVDERSAAYMACGMASETGEPVVLSCTGATASRNYMSGLTEAYYRKLPVLAVTSHQGQHKVGHHIAQVIDRSWLPKDVVKLSVNLPIIKDEDDKWDGEIKVNQAILELKRNGGGPVHINLPTQYSRNFEIKELPDHQVIQRYIVDDKFPTLPKGRIAIFIGSHHRFDKKEIEIIDTFCDYHNGVVFCDHTSNYNGKYKIQLSLLVGKKETLRPLYAPDLLIHIGEISGDYTLLRLNPKKVWRISQDGELRDTFRKLDSVFEMNELAFFNYYENNESSENEYFSRCHEIINLSKQGNKDFPFSNIWVAQKTASMLPKNCVIHFAILNSLRSWNFAEIHESVSAYSNVGGFGIDGCLSSLIGASLMNSNKLYYGVIGDLSLFYDINALGNRFIGKNLRLIVINNGIGQEFKNYDHPASEWKERANEYVAAKGHFGNQSKTLLKNYVTDLGFKYYSASNKTEFSKICETFFSEKHTSSSMIFEVFTNENDENDALKIMKTAPEDIQEKATKIVKQLMGEKTTKKLKSILSKK